MKILNSKSFIKLNEQQVINDIVPVTDENAIRNILVHVAKESERHSLNCEDNSKRSIFDKTLFPQRDKLTRQFASLDISYRMLQKKEISDLIATIFRNSAAFHYECKLEDDVYVESKSDEWCDDEPGEPGSYSTFWKMSYDFEDTIKYISDENFAIRTYNLQILYSQEKDSICVYHDGYTPTTVPSAFADEYDRLPDDLIPIKNDIDIVYEMERIYDRYCEKLKRDYDPIDY